MSNNFGISAAEELKRSQIVRKNKDPIADFLSLFRGRKYGWTLVALGCLLLISPTLTKIFFIPLIIIRLFTNAELTALPLFLPSHSKQKIDPNDWIPSKTGRILGPPSGYGYLGNTPDGYEVWNTKEKSRRHMLYLATTGGGKSVGLTSLTVSFALCQASGYSYTDGKAQLDLCVEHLSNAFRFNRGLDFLIISYITGGQDIWGRTEHLMSNTFNPYSNASYSDISELQKALLDGDNDIWAKRAESFSSALTKVLVYLRDHGEIQLSVGSYIPYLSLEAVGKLAGRSDIPPIASSQLVEFLRTVPGMTEAFFTSIMQGKAVQSTTVYDQFGFITMQLIPLFNMLVGDYGFIFQCLQGQVSMKDCVINRRILMVLLPALEKSSSTLANLGRITLAAQKSMMGSSLGSRFEGDVTTNIKNSATSASVPYLSINDEIGYYFVEGTAVAAAQSRSLYIMMVYAAQDLPGMRRLSDMASKETDSVIGNTVTKMGGFLMDKQSIEMFKDQMGEAYTTEEDRKDVEKSGIFYGSHVVNQVNTVRRSRVDIRDFNTLIEGEFYIQQQDRFFLVSMPQLTASELAFTVMNDFLPCPPYSKFELNHLINGMNTYSDAFQKILEKRKNIETTSASQNDLKMISDNFLKAEQSGLPAASQAIAVFSIFSDQLDEAYNNIFKATFTHPLNNESDKLDESIDESTDFDSTAQFDVGNSEFEDQDIAYESDIEEYASEVIAEHKQTFTNIFSNGLLDKTQLSADLESINALIEPTKPKEEIKKATSKTIENIADVSGYPGKQRLKPNPELQLRLLQNLKRDLTNR
jgi:hypothetical protein